jgi:hypothetical protein
LLDQQFMKKFTASLARKNKSHANRRHETVKQSKQTPLTQTRLTLMWLIGMPAARIDRAASG